MRSLVTCAVLASAASAAAAQLGSPLFEYPDAVPLDKRQEPGTPRYQCHEDCGVLITLGRQDGYCETAEWTDRYGRCMSCALEYGVWQYYSGSVTAAAAKCGLTPVPSLSGAVAATTPAPATTTSPAPAPTAATTTIGTSAAGPSDGESSSPSSAVAASSLSSAAAGVPATTLSTQTTTAASGTASTAAGTSAAAATRVHSIGTSVVIPSGTPTPSAVFAGAGRNAAAAGLTFVGVVLAAAL